MANGVVPPSLLRRGRHALANPRLWMRRVLLWVGAIAVGVAAILVPLPYAIDDHQTANARWLEKNNAAFLLPQIEMDWKKIAALLEELEANRDRLYTMAKNARSLAQPDAADDVAAMCLEVARG